MAKMATATSTSPSRSVSTRAAATVSEAVSEGGVRVVPMLARETLSVGIDVGKASHVAGFVSPTLLARHPRFESCPALSFEQSRAGFRALVDRIQAFVPLTQVYVLLEATGH